MNEQQPINEASYIEKRGKHKRRLSRSKKMQRIVSSLLVLFTVGALVFAGVDMVSATSNAYLICVDGQDVACMVSEREADEAFELAADAVRERVGGGEDFAVSYSNRVEIKEIPSVGVEYASTSDAAALLGELLDFQAAGVALMVDDEVAFYVSSAETAIQAVNEAKSHYGSLAEEDVTSVYTEQQISIVSADVSLTDVLAVEEAVNMLLYGDTVPVAAEAAQPMVNIMVERSYSEEGPLPYKTVKVDDDTMARGEEKVVTEGVDGWQEIFYKHIEKNGELVDTQQVGSNVITAAVDEVINVGTRRLIGGGFSSASYGELAWPLMDGVGIVSSRFGWRSRGWHSGVDVANAIYTTIVAVEAGTVTVTEYQGGYGNLICIDHGNGVETRYAHCAEFYCSVGDTVSRGQAIACIGMTGTTTGPHVHFEVRVNGTAVDPLPYLGVE